MKGTPRKLPPAPGTPAGTLPLRATSKVPLLLGIPEAYNRRMTMTILKCVACGKTILVRDEPNEKPSRICACNSSMVERDRLNAAR